MKAEAGPARVTRAAVATGLGVAAAGACVLLAYRFGREDLFAIIPGWTPISRNGAALFVALGASLALLAGGRKTAAKAAAAAVLAAAGAFALEHAADLQLGLGQHPSIHTSAALLCLAAAVLADGARARRLGPGLAAAGGAVALVTVVAHLFQLQNRFGGAVHPHREMSLVSGALAIVTASGLLATRPSEGLFRSVLSAGPGGLVARRLLGGLIAMSPAIVLIALGARFGWYLASTAAAIVVLLGLAQAVLFILATARELDRVDAERREHEERARKLREAVISMTSHELGNPVTTVSVVLDMLAGDAELALNARQREMVELGRTSARRMGRMLEDFLTLEKLEAGTLRFHLEPVDLWRVVREAVRSVEAAADLAGVAVKLAPPLEGLVCRGDADRLTQVVVNLAANAIRFTPRGGEVEVRIDPRAGHARVSVCDRGPGIPAELRPRLFQRFAQAKGAARQGSGLGLSISKGIVEGLGGRIGYEDRPGGGTTFFFELPL